MNPPKILFALIVLLFLLAPAAYACSCSESPTVDREFAWAGHVVILKLNSIKSGPRLTIEKVFKGNFQVGKEHFLVQGGGANCIWTFDEEDIGQEYLFYLSDKMAEIATTCSRSRPLKWAAADISYLENREKVRGRTRISGQITQFERKTTEETEQKNFSLQDQVVRIIGNGKYLNLRTDENGVYEVYGLPPGQYRVEPQKIQGYQASSGYRIKSSSSATVSVLGQGFAEMNFTFSIENSITGQLIDADGKPLSGVQLQLVPASGTPYKYFIETTRSDRDGSFRFENVPAGSYVIAGNEKGEITSDNPYPKFYSSGTADRSTATVINLGAGDELRGFTVKASRPAEVVTVSGRVVYEDGTPVLGGTVNFDTRDDGQRTAGHSYAFSDRQSGAFQIKLLKGQEGFLHAYIFPSDYMFPNCTERIASAKKKAFAVKEGSLLTKPERFVATSDMSGFEIKFPFTLCPRR